MHESSELQTFHPGDEVPMSGIYKVTHRGHHHDHEVTCLSGDQFPVCCQCREQVRFSLLIAAHAIHRHIHFYQAEASLRGPVV
jgi:hypothetical protein